MEEFWIPKVVSRRTRCFLWPQMEDIQENTKPLKCHSERSKANEWPHGRGTGKSFQVKLAFQFLGRLGREHLAHPAFSAQGAQKQKLFSGTQTLGTLSTKRNVWFEHRTGDSLHPADFVSYWRSYMIYLNTWGIIYLGCKYLWYFYKYLIILPQL